MHAEIEKIGISVGLTGWDLKELVATADPHNKAGFVMYLPIVIPVIGAIIAGIAFLTMKGGSIVTDRHLELAGIACIVLSVVFFAFVYSQFTADGLVGRVIENASVRPGPATIMQIAGGLLITLTAMKSRQA